MKNIIHEYFKKEIDQNLILIQLDPNTFSGLELLVASNGIIKKTRREFDKDIYNDLDFDGFISCSPLEFNRYLNKVK